MNKILKSDYLLMIVSVLIAILIWIYVVYEKNPMHEVWIRDLPINYINQSSDFESGKLIVLDESDKSVDIKIRGRRTAISSARLSKITCTANMRDINRAGEYSLPVNVSFSTDGIEVLQKTPYNINVQVDEVVTMTLNIELENTGTLKEGYVLGETSMTPGEIKVTGPKSLLANIKKVSASVDLNDRAESIKGLYKIKLYNRDGEEYNDERISRNIDYVDVNFDVLSTKTVKIKPVLSSNKNSDGNKVTVKNTKPETILIKGSFDALKEITEIETYEIDVSGLTESGQIETYLNVEKLPSKVSCADDGAAQTPISVNCLVSVKQPSEVSD